MSVQSEESGAVGREHHQQTCEAPSCWESASRVEIEGVDVDQQPVLCETHRKCYIGVST